MGFSRFSYRKPRCSILLWWPVELNRNYHVQESGGPDVEGRGFFGAMNIFWWFGT